MKCCIGLVYANRLDIMFKYSFIFEKIVFDLQNILFRLRKKGGNSCCKQLGYYYCKAI